MHLLVRTVWGLYKRTAYRYALTSARRDGDGKNPQTTGGERRISAGGLGNGLRGGRSYESAVCLVLGGGAAEHHRPDVAFEHHAVLGVVAILVDAVGHGVRHSDTLDLLHRVDERAHGVVAAGSGDGQWHFDQMTGHDAFLLPAPAMPPRPHRRR